MSFSRLARRMICAAAAFSLALSFGLSGCGAGAATPADAAGPAPTTLPDDPLDEARAAQLAAQGWPSSARAVCTRWEGMTLERSSSEVDARSVDLRGAELLDTDYSRLNYDTDTVFPDELPAGFDPDAVLENGKDPGLGLRALHEAGCTGAGVNVGIVDQPLSPHQEYAGKLRYYYDFNEENDSDTVSEGSMHGPAVTSLLAGETTGVAPDVRIYYVAFRFPENVTDEETRDSQAGANMLEGVRHLLALNETLPQEDKLSVISVSRGFQKSEEYPALEQQAAEQGVWLATVTSCLLFTQGCCRPQGADPDDAALYTLLPSAPRYAGKAYVLVPQNGRTTAAPATPQSYTYWSNGGASWLVPYVAGLYALARQADPTLTPEAFPARLRQNATLITLQTPQGGQIARVAGWKDAPSK